MSPELENGTNSFIRTEENPELKGQLIEIAKKKIDSADPAHDYNHAQRVLKNALKIAKIENDNPDNKEKADLDVITAAALFHDLVNHPKNDPCSRNAPSESAKETEKILQNLPSFPSKKIPKVAAAIKTCSFTSRKIAKTKESKIISDADLLEQTGIIAFMRVFTTGGQLSRLLYNPEDPFCNSNRQLDDKKFSLDVFFTRSFRVRNKMHTSAGKRFASQRTRSLLAILSNLRRELQEEQSDIKLHLTFGR